jgi:hypothetical protein
MRYVRRLGVDQRTSSPFILLLDQYCLLVFACGLDNASSTLSNFSNLADDRFSVSSVYCVRSPRMPAFVAYALDKNMAAVRWVFATKETLSTAG